MRKIIPGPVPIGSKWCFPCKQAKPLSAFGVDRRKPDGVRHCCDECSARKRRERQEIRRMLDETYERLGGR